MDLKTLKDFLDISKGKTSKLHFGDESFLEKLISSYNLYKTKEETLTLWFKDIAYHGSLRKGNIPVERKNWIEGETSPLDQFKEKPIIKIFNEKRVTKNIDDFEFFCFKQRVLDLHKSLEIPLSYSYSPDWDEEGLNFSKMHELTKALDHYVIDTMRSSPEMKTRFVDFLEIGQFLQGNVSFETDFEEIISILYNYGWLKNGMRNSSGTLYSFGEELNPYILIDIPFNVIDFFRFPINELNYFYHYVGSQILASYWYLEHLVYNLSDIENFILGTPFVEEKGLPFPSTTMNRNATTEEHLFDRAGLFHTKHYISLVEELPERSLALYAYIGKHAASLFTPSIGEKSYSNMFFYFDLGDEIDDFLPAYNISLTNISVTAFLIVIVFMLFFYNFWWLNKDKFLPTAAQLTFEKTYTVPYSILQENVLNNAGKRFLPFIFSLFCFLLCANLIGLIPFIYTITSQLIVTFFLALVSFLLANILGISYHKTMFHSLFVPSGAPSLLLFLLIPIELISYIFRIISLSVRLFANMMAGHTLLHVLVDFGLPKLHVNFFYKKIFFFTKHAKNKLFASKFGLVKSKVAFTLLNAWIFKFYLVVIQFFIVLCIVEILFVLEFGVGLIQAYVFTILTSIYINDARNVHLLH